MEIIRLIGGTVSYQALADNSFNPIRQAPVIATKPHEVARKETRTSLQKISTASKR